MPWGKIPEECVKKIKFGSIDVSAHNPLPNNFAEGDMEVGQKNPDNMNLSFRVYAEGCSFNLDIIGKDNLLKLKELIEFTIKD
jgi:hypothetical protein